MIDRFKEPSTWAAIGAGLAAILGAGFAESELWTGVTAAGVGIATIAGIIMKERSR